MHTRAEIEQLCNEYSTELLSLESEPKKKYNREVKVTVRCCIAGCNGTVTKSIRNHFLSKNFGCEEHAIGIKKQKTRATILQNGRTRARYFEESKEEHHPVLIPDEPEEDETFHVTEMTNKDETNESSPLDATDLTKEFKQKFFENHRFFEYNGQRWTKANDVALFLEYLDARKMIYHHVPENDKINFKKFPESIQMEMQQHYDSDGTIQPETMFINEKGITKLINKSNKPVATGKKRKIEHVYVATTALYEKQDFYKIGKSANSRKRINQMNTSRHPDDEMYLCHVATCYNALKYEQLVHGKLKKYRVAPNREFFQLNLDEIIKVVDDVCAK